MILKRAEINNIKSYYPGVDVNFESNLNLFVGPNGGGKSNLFEIIQGVINNILYRHVTLKANPNKRSLNHAHKNLAWVLEYDNIDQTNLITNLLDKHFNHADQPSSIYLTFKVTSSDIVALNKIKTNKDAIIQVLRTKVAASQEIADTIDLITPTTNFNFLKNKEIKLFILPPDNLTIEIADFAPFMPANHALVALFLKLIKNLNAMYELSILFPTLQFSPSSRYFGPNRQIDQPQSNVPINLSTLGSFEDSYTKGVNLTKENTPSLISGSQVKLCQLVEDGKAQVVNIYKDYLRKYLDLEIEIKKLDDNKYVIEYEIEYKRSSGIPMRLSSGEKEFFNLITGLILSGINNGVVMVDEPELHLHSQRQQAIQDLIFNLSKDFNIQFFIITHSPKFINELTIRNIFRIYKEDLNSHLVQPTQPLTSTSRDLLHLLTTTNNEKAFFADKVILVEGPADLIVFTKALVIIKKKLSNDNEIEIIEVLGKENLIKYRNLLNRWTIENWMIADLDYLDQISTNPGIATNPIVLRYLNNLKSKYSSSSGRFHTHLSAIEITTIAKKLFKHEHVLILEKGVVEDYFVALRGTPIGNKVDNALQVSLKMGYNKIDSEIRNAFKVIIH